MAKKGIPLTEEHKASLSKAAKGRKHSTEHKAKIALTIANRKNYVSPLRGRKLSEKHKAKLRENHWDNSGDKNPAWKGGISKLNARERRQYSRKIAPLVFQRDNYTCQICYQYGVNIHADHIKSWSEYPELRFEIDNLRTLCIPCHYYVTFKKCMPFGSKWASKYSMGGY